MDKTNFAQSLMHNLKGFFGTGILAMPATFAHCGLVNASIGLPFLCLIAAYCIHVLVRSSQHLYKKANGASQQGYGQLAEAAFRSGPIWMRPFSGAMCTLVDFIQTGLQLGICSVYLVFIVDNLGLILETYDVRVLTKKHLFGIMLPIILMLCYIRTLRRLAIASACANLLQVVCYCIIMEFILRDISAGPQIDYFRPVSEVALGFGTAMFAFEGIGVVLPILNKMKRREQMAAPLGIINLSIILTLLLNMIVGLFGYLRFGPAAKGSITLNLPAKEPLYDLVRLMVTCSVFLTFPLQFSVGNQIVWKYVSARWLRTNENDNKDNESNSKGSLVFDYLNRTVMVVASFTLAMSVPKLNLIMEFVGSITASSLAITLPAIIHLATFWEHTQPAPIRLLMLVVDSFVILFGLLASFTGSYFSLREIIASFGATGHVLNESVELNYTESGIGFARTGLVSTPTFE